MYFAFNNAFSMWYVDSQQHYYLALLALLSGILPNISALTLVVLAKEYRKVLLWLWIMDS